MEGGKRVETYRVPGLLSLHLHHVNEFVDGAGRTASREDDRVVLTAVRALLDDVSVDRCRKVCKALKFMLRSIFADVDRDMNLRFRDGLLGSNILISLIENSFGKTTGESVSTSNSE